ncbi:Amidase (plasmid) [Paraburkholderia phymatum STM815]|uniref:Amidase n=2 Tax=Paraburkholderia phymatum TaxID=148447 RepID=B2JWK8_PARP8|nr:Amidase [Paraburkholderia phymatum STM815]
MRSRASVRERFEWNCNMTEASPSFVTELIAQRGNVAASRARLDAAIERANALEPTLRAFTYRPESYVEPDACAPLAGLPVGVKDLIDTVDMPTAYGSPIYREHRPQADAAIVTKLREYGALVFGKTVTTEFAWRQPGPTVNPWSHAHTPGGSSSGSAAAVGAGIVPLALGTQTVGSVIRPAAYCGAVGYKPSFGSIARDGVHPLAASLDHIGFFAQSVETAALAHALFVAGRPDTIESAANWQAWFAPLAAPPRLGIVRTPFDARLQDAQKADFEAALAQLRAAGAEVIDIGFRVDLARIVDALQVILRVEAWHAMGPVSEYHRAQLSHHMQALIDEGAAMPEARYRDALALQSALRAESAALLAGCDALVSVPATGAAPEGLDDTGDPVFCAPWSLLGVPALTVPSGWTAQGLPLGFQIVGAYGEDLATLRTAAWVEGAIGARRDLALDAYGESAA